MENYREKLKLTNAIIAVASFALAAFNFLSFAGEQGWILFPELAGDEQWQTDWRAFVSGAAFGILLVMIFILIRNIRALIDEKFFKKLYVADHDERSNQIYLYSRSAGMQAFLILGLVAAVVAGYFSMVVSFTIMACLVSASVICLLIKLYYSVKF